MNQKECFVWNELNDYTLKLHCYYCEAHVRYSLLGSIIKNKACEPVTDFCEIPVLFKNPRAIAGYATGCFHLIGLRQSGRKFPSKTCLNSSLYT